MPGLIDISHLIFENIPDVEDDNKVLVSQSGLNHCPSSFEYYSDSPLCIPDDPIEDIELFPNFADCSISLNDCLTIPEHENSFLFNFPTTPRKETEDGGKRLSLKNINGLSIPEIPMKKVRSGRPGRARVWRPLQENENPGKFYYNQIRRCGHCNAEKTPQWRMGPMGPKTLCNACGVRYKSGRLVPEYRPAASPSFNDEMHSNNHKKIMKIMKMKNDIGKGLR
ncbi:hypothetical protein HHK36_004282 [Tetracentron sinense]|uniref:GATA-type domain-containing protein n=1 Tax=Tetracentron sinense TaxID=13715 RepID=A0A835DT18_TETSI|nr:hypothetical protein HHK36_004282 [Tetracentron sinense]